MAFVMKVKDRLQLTGWSRLPETLRQFRKPQPGTKVSFPLDPDIFRRMLVAFPDLEYDDETLAWYRVERMRESQLEDARVEPHGVTWPGARDFQTQGASWLRLAGRAILADEQGAGKTVTSLISLNDLPVDSRVVIICSSKKRQDWADHVRDWTNFSSLILDGDPEKRHAKLDDWSSGVIIMNYDIAALHAEDLMRVDAVIVDEAHKLRNRKTVTAKAMKLILYTCDRLMLLTASPIMNRSDDYWMLLNFIDHKRFSSYWSFIYRFFYTSDDGFGIKVEEVRDEEREAFDSVLWRYTLMRTVEGRPYTVVRRGVKHVLTGEERRLYDEMDSQMESTYGHVVSEASGVLAQITRLRQLACHPALVFPDYVGPSKLDTLLREVRNRNGKMVVFTSFAKLCHLGADYMRAHGYNCVVLTGASKEGQAEYEFQSGNADLIFVTHGAGGEGLNLHAGKVLFFLDVAWTPEGNRQAYKRIDRPLKQKADEIEIVFIKSAKTVEDHIYKIVSKKQPVTLAAISKLRD